MEPFKGFSVRELRIQRRQILLATAQAIGLPLDGEPSPDLLPRMVEERRPDVAPKLAAFLAADDALVSATEQESISEHDYAAAVTKRTMARNSLEAAAKAQQPPGRP